MIGVPRTKPEPNPPNRRPERPIFLLVLWRALTPALGTSAAQLHPKSNHRPLYVGMGPLCGRRATALCECASSGVSSRGPHSGLQVAPMQSGEAPQRRRWTWHSARHTLLAYLGIKAVVKGRSRRAEGAGFEEPGFEAEEEPGRHPDTSRSAGRPGKQPN